MSKAIVLACGNPLHGDDGVPVHLARELDATLADPNVEILCSQKWAPEIAERISHADLALFVDASAAISPGAILVQVIEPAANTPGVTAHTMKPEQIICLAQHVYGRVPERTFLVTIGVRSFTHDRQLSAPVREAIPAALAKIKSLLAGESVEAPS
jgi:hydrogenase maturation protease